MKTLFYLKTFTTSGDSVFTFRLNDYKPQYLGSDGVSFAGPAQSYTLVDYHFIVEEDGITSQQLAQSDIAGLEMVSSLGKDFVQMYYVSGYDVLVVNAPNGAPLQVYYGKEIHGRITATGLEAEIDGKMLYTNKMPYFILKHKHTEG